MKKIFLPLITCSALIQAATGCLLVQSDDMNVTWTAYKTFAKVGVKGQFTSVNYTPIAKEGKNFKALFIGSTVTIDSTHITTGLNERDNTLVRMFFKKLKSPTIKAKIVSIKSDAHIRGKPRTGMMDTLITLNEKTITVPMNFHYEKGHLQATGTIDLFDFAAKAPLATINKSCYDLHDGKTWNDVTIGFSTTIEATLCNVQIKK
ncbi:MAG: YceI family protein [Campylobacterota bacterium]|nr:YceI family protein [Campylobacterota bacterium]